MVSEHGVASSKQRFAVLGSFLLLAITNAYQWDEFTSISDKMAYLYHTDQVNIDLLAVVYSIIYVPFVIPAGLLLNRIGLRWSMIMATVLNAIGAIIKIFTVTTGTFFMTFIAQCFASFAQLYILSLPAELAAVWFPAGELSSATGVGVLGIQVGAALGLIVPTLIVSEDLPGDDNCTMLNATMYYMNSTNNCTQVDHDMIKAIMSDQLRWNNIGVAIVMVPSSPRHAPSIAQKIALEKRGEGHAHSLEDELATMWVDLKKLSRHRGYMMLLISYSITTGLFYAFAVILNPIIQEFHPGDNTDVGLMGFAFAAAGLVGIVVAGPLMDKTRKYRWITLSCYTMTFVSMAFFNVSVPFLPIPLVVLAAGLTGFSMTGYLPVGFEFAAEITYPMSEFLTCNLLNLGSNFLGIVFTYQCQWMITNGWVIAAGVSMNVFLLVGLVLSFLIPEQLLRQEAENSEEKQH